MKIVIDTEKSEAPEGYEFTGEYRAAKLSEHYWDNGEVKPSASSCEYPILRPTEKPKIFPWYEVADGVLVTDIYKNHYLLNKEDHLSVIKLLSLSYIWQVWTGGEQPLPDGVEVRIEERNGQHKIGKVEDIDWTQSSKNPYDVIGFGVLNIGDYKYPDEV